MEGAVPVLTFNRVLCAQHMYVECSTKTMDIVKRFSYSFFLISINSVRMYMNLRFIRPEICCQANEYITYTHTYVYHNHHNIDLNENVHTHNAWYTYFFGNKTANNGLIKLRYATIANFSFRFRFRPTHHAMHFD